ncbi:MAG: hypothetical protein H5U26_03920 [Immundisolibacter sp.]|uniref:MAE_28990/MAE_18760 family HEPN-like nuclease n=1 Tax=Immundisolibacter sp. TaxID=1934948 RepID=UPI001986C4C3|nr:MAE_28990/MAE_18760 family HEPN-like nuclease [Immundisolibacter sp.]MBC7161237.1 hypothetical protein [Immundisolibacter sp.]
MKSQSDELEEDLRWREAELASLKRLAIFHSENEIVYRATLRACWALLYAHFEGFTKFAWELLLDKVEAEKLSVKELSREFQALALEKKFQMLRGNTETKMLWEFFSTILPAELENSAAFHPDCRLQTDSNLWPNVFERECARVGINSNILSDERSRIKTLVARRNDIAHGKNMTIKSVDEYTEYENAAFLVLHDLAVQVLSLLEDQQYLQKS